MLNRFSLSTVNGSAFSPFSCSVQFSSVAQSCLTLCNPTNRSTPGLPVHHQLPEFTQTHVHWVGDAIQPFSSSVVPFSCCLQSFPTSGSFQMSQFFTSGGQNIGVSASTSVLPMNTQEWSLRRQVKQSGIAISCRIIQFVVIHTIKGFSVVSEEVDVFSGIILLFLWPSGCWQFDFWFFCFF